MTSRIPIRLRRLAAAAVMVASVLGSTARLQAQDAQGGAQKEKAPHDLTDKTREAFGKIKPLMDEKKWDEILALLNSISNVDPKSYDMAVILDTKAKVYLQKEQLAPAIEPQEAALRLSDAYGYFDENQTQQTLSLLARLIYAEALNIKDKNVQQQYITRAAGYLKRFMQSTKKPTQDDTMFYAQLLYAQAIADEKHVNLDLLREARRVVEQGMREAIQPKDGFYQLLIALLQQENELTQTANLLELVVAKFPQKKDYWGVLAASYLQLAQGEKDERKAREYNIRAINAIERAQALGIMTTPKDNYNLVAIYVSVGQFSKATELLHSGLRKGAIESTPANWLALGYYYQQANKEYQAIDALQEGAKLFPKDGMLELQIGEIYRGLDKTKEARDHYRLAVKKDNLAKPHVAYQLLAYAAMEMDDWNEAQQAINEAAKHPEFQKDNQMKALKAHIDATVEEREEAAKQKEQTKQKAKTI